ncbi:MAG: UDP-3-O-(3-hydroxymyristoyl)glucosamine N-acyltransferase [Casimicrobiaceae bacterium]|nr:UDP-3-O-(3-hydroxymyristoyl)glucosamine N-acyltransferase [Casimicrobiaceae bacterium]
MARSVARPLTARELAEALGQGQALRLEGSPEARIGRVSALEHAGPGDLAFVADRRGLEAARAVAASVLIVPTGEGAWRAQARLISARPRLAFARALELLFPFSPVGRFVSPQAFVAADACLGEVWIEAFASVAAGAAIGDGTRIAAGARIGAGARLGRNCLIYPNAVVGERVVLGDRCIVHAGAVIGADGFGFETDEAGHWVKIAQLGSVVIGSDVEIGASTTIDRGAIEDTVIEDGVKIDDQVHIAHNCRIGAHTIIAGCVGIAGSTRIGAHCRIGGAAMIVGHITICDGAIVSGGTLVAESIDRPGRYTGVFPTTEHRHWQRIAAQLRRGARRNA